ncbi:hypothetical protein [Halobellus ordinarius]|uniref:hypothetical protein n=1 Tax=Halobellus ordinarius TaxID=3075120 RepID=UPI00288007A3|nr:hypothetical protein [Halobellus sp. ZY16]
MTDSGEVAVRENGSVTAIETTSFGETISIDLDSSPPSVGVPEQTAVVFEDDGAEDPDDNDVRADGGMVSDRVTVRQRGVGLSGENRTLAIGVMVAAYAASGYLFAVSEQLAGIVTFAAAALATYFILYRRAE